MVNREILNNAERDRLCNLLAEKRDELIMRFPGTWMHRHVMAEIAEIRSWLHTGSLGNPLRGVWLRFLKRIEWFELVVNPSSAYGHGHVKYTCGLKGNEVHFTPELSHAVEQREFAKKFARRHRATGGEYCFAMPIGRVQEILDCEQVSLRFPNVRYLQRLKDLHSTARLRKDQIPKFAVSWRRMETLDQFRDALRAHGWKISGKKSDLVKRTAQLAAERYAEIVPVLCEWFSDQRFVRVPKDQTFAEPFPCSKTSRSRTCC